MQISKRLEAVASMVTSGCKVADVGTDHGYIPIELVSSGRNPEAIAMDVNQGPLQRAVEHIQQYALEDRIAARLSDGLAALVPGEVQSIVIAGMGGPLTVRILQDGDAKLAGCRELILQPQSELRQVRAYIEQKGWHIVREEMVCEDGKYYPMMKVLLENTEMSTVPHIQEQDADRQAHPEKGEADGRMSEAELRYGPWLLRLCHPVLLEYLKKEQTVKGQILQSLAGQNTEASAQRRLEVQADLDVIREALGYFTQGENE